MITYPNAKINLGLNIVEDRPDGYHNLQTVFYPIPLTDRLEIEPLEQGPLQFTQGGIPLNAGGEMENNLVVKVVRRLQQLYGLTDSLRITLDKHIPSGAGLGGGSADAAFAMQMLVQLFHLPMDRTTMHHELTKLGADCPFFMENRAVYAEGIGEKMTPISLNLDAYTLVLVKPTDFVSTREAFARIVSHYPTECVKHLITLPVEEWKGQLSNDFEESVFPQHPAISRIKEQLYNQGALYASMSGSGSTVYGIFNQPIEGLEQMFHDCFCFQAPFPLKNNPRTSCSPHDLKS